MVPYHDVVLNILFESKPDKNERKVDLFDSRKKET